MSRCLRIIIIIKILHDWSFIVSLISKKVQKTNHPKLPSFKHSEKTRFKNNRRFETDRQIWTTLKINKRLENVLIGVSCRLTYLFCSIISKLYISFFLNLNAIFDASAKVWVSCMHSFCKSPLFSTKKIKHFFNKETMEIWETEFNNSSWLMHENRMVRDGQWNKNVWHSF
jgi:hypothetical protein